jgi:hypothetical protein
MHPIGKRQQVLPLLVAKPPKRLQVGSSKPQGSEQGDKVLRKSGYDRSF